MQRHSYSALQTLLDCEREYALRFLENLEADKPERILYLRGTAFHAVVAADLLERGSSLGSLRNFPTSLKLTGDTNLDIEWVKRTEGFKQWVEPYILSGGERTLLTADSVIEALETWEQAQGNERREEIKADLGESLTDRISNTWARYKLHWQDRMAAELPLLVEFEWERPAPNGMRLQGRVDAVVYDQTDALTIVRDTKTHDSWPSEPDAVLDLMNSQLHLQAWGIAPALRQMTEAKVGGSQGPALVPQAVEFDRVRIKKPTTPKLTTKGLLSKSITDFDQYTYTDWCQSEEAASAGYEWEEAVSKRASETEWFRRSMKPLSMNAVAAHVKSMQRQAKRASELVAQDAAIQPQKACAWCPFLSLCRAEIIGGRPEEFHPSEFGLRKIRV